MSGVTPVQLQLRQRCQHSVIHCPGGEGWGVDTLLPYFRNQTPRLLFISSHDLLQLLHVLETKTFLTKITNDLVMATPIDSRKSRQTRNAINQPQSHPIEKCRI